MTGVNQERGFLAESSSWKVWILKTELLNADSSASSFIYIGNRYFCSCSYGMLLFLKNSCWSNRKHFALVNNLGDILQGPHQPWDWSSLTFLPAHSFFLSTPLPPIFEHFSAICSLALLIKSVLGSAFQSSPFYTCFVKFCQISSKYNQVTAQSET